MQLCRVNIAWPQVLRVFDTVAAPRRCGSFKYSTVCLTYELQLLNSEIVMSVDQAPRTQGGGGGCGSGDQSPGPRVSPRGGEDTWTPSQQLGRGPASPGSRNPVQFPAVSFLLSFKINL